MCRAGIDDVAILERGEGVGGTWRENRYPGAACDVRSHLYSFSFAPNPEWSRSFSPQPEIEAYLERCAERFSLAATLHTKHEVLEARYDTSGGWELDTNEGPWRAETLVWATGPLSELKVPELPGLSSFSGEVFHSAAWRSDLDLSSRRVAVVGTGASAVQFVPEIQPLVERLTIFQRTPPWIVPRRDHEITPWHRYVYRKVPLIQRLVRAGIYAQQELVVPVMQNRPKAVAAAEALAQKHLERQVADRELRHALTPRFHIGCKRILLSDDYYPTLCQDNVHVVTAPATEVRAHAVVDAEGGVHDVDTIIFATGFNASEPGFARRIVGRTGRLSEVWQEGMEAYLGTVVHGFPNLFLLLGPNTVLGHNSVIFMIESQLSYLVDYLQKKNRLGFSSAEVRQKVQRLYNLEVQRRLATSVWLNGGCASWYLDHRGRNTTLWPGYTIPYRLRTRSFRPDEFVLR